VTLQVAKGRAETVRPFAQPRTKKLRVSWTAWIMLAPALLGLLVFFVYPLAANVYYSFTSFDLLSNPQWIGARNYLFLFTRDPRLVTASLNTLWLVVILVPVRIVTALAVAGLLTRLRTATGFWRTVFYLPALLPPVASVIAFVFLFNPGTGPVNIVLHAFGIQGPLWFSDPLWSKPSLVLLGVWVMGDIMIIFLASLLDVPREQYEAAELDGANGAQKVLYVTIPTIVPVLVFAVITGVIAALQYFTEAAIASGVASGRTGVGVALSQVMGYPNDSLLTYTEWLYARGFGNFQLGYAAALAVVLFVVTGSVLVLLLRQFKAFNTEG
jgi:multiple sugar transport system permease protein